MKKHKHHLWYLVLASIGLLLLGAMIVMQGNKSAQFTIASLFVCVYIAWGVFHHIIDRTLRLSVVLEYILIGSTAFFLLKTVLIR